MHRRTLRTKGKMMTVPATKKTTSTTTSTAATTSNNNDRCKKTSTKHHHKINRNSLSDQLICPLTKKLPIEPVMAEDGQVYERNAIELYFKKKEEAEEYSFGMDSGSGSLSCDSQEEVLSPSTQQPMGKHLTQTKQHENTIEILIEKGVIKGELAKTWKEQRAAKKKAQEVLRNLMFGQKQNVSPQDEKFAKSWYSKDQKGVNVPAVAALGAIILHGNCHGMDAEEQKQQLIEGMSYILWAKKRGSILSAYILGMGCADGKYGLPTNKEKACHWLEKVVNPAVCDSKDSSLDIPDGYYTDFLPTAQAKLKELQRENGRRRSVQFLLPDP